MANGVGRNTNSSQGLPQVTHTNSNSNYQSQNQLSVQ